jgi:integrase
MPPRCAAWVSQVGKQFADRLRRCSLADAPAVTTLADFASDVFSRRQLKPSTRAAYQTALQTLFAHFGPGCDLRAVDEAAAERYRDFLRQSGLREATVRRRCGVARDLWACAARQRLISQNPFAALPVTVRGSPDRAFLVPGGECLRLMEAAPDSQWRVLIALGRWGALRVPSEPLALTWAHIDWGDAGRPATLRVPSPKTESHGAAFRVIPLFPELRGPLEELFSLMQPAATDFVIARYRSSASNLRTQLGRIAKRAGVVLWPKPWANMRATRDAELRRDFPAHVVRQWVGHTERVAQEHYLLASDESYLRRAAGGASSAGAPKKADQKSEAKSEALHVNQT